MKKDYKFNNQAAKEERLDNTRETAYAFEKPSNMAGTVYITRKTIIVQIYYGL
jgi:hypothetical protein